MNKYMIFYSGDCSNRIAEANENEVTVRSSIDSAYSYSLRKDGDNFIYVTSGPAGEKETKIPGGMFFDLPELTAILNMENNNLFSKVSICKTEVVKELF
jgi:hypothetical protein